MASPFTGDVRTVRRTPPPPRNGKPYTKLYKVTPDRKHNLFIASPELTTVLVHVVDSRTLPCTGEAGQCWLDHTYELRQQHWLFVVPEGEEELRLVQVTPGLVKEKLPELVKKGTVLTGLGLQLWRSSKDDIRSAMLGRLYPAKKGQFIPVVPDMLTQLHALWSAENRPGTWGSVNEMLAAHLDSNPVRTAAKS